MVKASRRGIWLLAIVLAASVACIDSANAAPGRLVLPTLLHGRTAKRVKKFVPAMLWVYSESGDAIAGPGLDGGWPTGKPAKLDEGWYLIEVGNERAKQNRARIYVKSGQTTVVPSGLILVDVEAAEQQPPDVCPVWDADLDVYLASDPAPGTLVASNRSAMGQHSVGAVQVLAGFYRVAWNGFWKTVEVKSHMVYSLETGFAAPHFAHDYAIFDVKDRSAGGPTMRLCRTRGTRLLARSYHGSYTQPTQRPPFKRREWDTLTIVAPEVRGGPYQRVKGKGITGRVYSGDGSAPLLLWEIPEATPEEVVGDTAPADSGTKGQPPAPEEPPTKDKAPAQPTVDTPVAP